MQGYFRPLAQGFENDLNTFGGSGGNLFIFPFGMPKMRGNTYIYTRGPASPLPGLAGALPRASIPVSGSIVVFVYMLIVSISAWPVYLWVCVTMLQLLWLAVCGSEGFTNKTEICIIYIHTQGVPLMSIHIPIDDAVHQSSTLTWQWLWLCACERCHAWSGFILNSSFEPCCPRLNSKFICSCEFTAVCLCASTYHAAL